MYFFTQRGLKIRLEEKYCIAQSLKSLIDFREALADTEIFVTLREFLAFTYGLLLFLFRAGSMAIVTGAFLAAIIGMIVPLYPSTIKLYTKINLDTLFFEALFSIINTFHIDKLILFIIGTLRVGFVFTLMFFTAFYLTILLISILNFRWSKKVYKDTGLYITDVERTFINILRTHTKPKISFHEWIDNYKAYITKNQTIIDSQ